MKKKKKEKEKRKRKKEGDGHGCIARLIIYHSIRAENGSVPNKTFKISHGASLLTARETISYIQMKQIASTEILESDSNRRALHPSTQYHTLVGPKVFEDSREAGPIQFSAKPSSAYIAEKHCMYIILLLLSKQSATVVEVNGR